MKFKIGDVVQIQDRYLKDYSQDYTSKYEYVILSNYTTYNNYSGNDHVVIKLLRETNSKVTLGILKNELIIVHFDKDFPNKIVCQYTDYNNNLCYLLFDIDSLKPYIDNRTTSELITKLQELCTQI